MQSEDLAYHSHTVKTLTRTFDIFPTKVEDLVVSLKPWRQYSRTDKDGKMKGDIEADRKSKDADEQKEEIPSSGQAHIAPRGNTLSGVPYEAETMFHYLR